MPGAFDALGNAASDTASAAGESAERETRITQGVLAVANEQVAALAGPCVAASRKHLKKYLTEGLGPGESGSVVQRRAWAARKLDEKEYLNEATVEAAEASMIAYVKMAHAGVETVLTHGRFITTFFTMLEGEEAALAEGFATPVAGTDEASELGPSKSRAEQHEIGTPRGRVPMPVSFTTPPPAPRREGGGTGGTNTVSYGHVSASPGGSAEGAQIFKEALTALTEHQDKTLKEVSDEREGTK